MITELSEIPVRNIFHCSLKNADFLKPQVSSKVLTLDFVQCLRLYKKIIENTEAMPIRTHQLLSNFYIWFCIYFIDPLKIKHLTSHKKFKLWFRFHQTQFLDLKIILTGFWVRSTRSAIKTTSSRVVIGRILKFLMTFVNMTFSSSIANLCPMQFRIPAENAMKA